VVGLIEIESIPLVAEFGNDDWRDHYAAVERLEDMGVLDEDQIT
jgi:hypothetical protein